MINFSLFLNLFKFYFWHSARLPKLFSVLPVDADFRETCTYLPHTLPKIQKYRIWSSFCESGNCCHQHKVLLSCCCDTAVVFLTVAQSNWNLWIPVSWQVQCRVAEALNCWSANCEEECVHLWEFHAMKLLQIFPLYYLPLRADQEKQLWYKFPKLLRMVETDESMA